MTIRSYSFKLGDFECAVIYDYEGSFALDDLIVNATAEQLEKVARKLKLPEGELTVGYNCFLVRTGEQNVLIDAGRGNRLGPEVGQLSQGLRDLDLEPEDIDAVVITHADGDHIGGLLNEDGNPTYPNAYYVMWQGAWDYWAFDNVLDWPQEILDRTRNTYATIESRVKLVEGDTEFLSGLWLVPAVGHKADHVVVRITSQGDQLLFVGDAIVHPLLIEHLDWYTGFDLDPKQALATKRLLLDWAASERMLLSATHFPLPALGRVQRREQGWEWLPVDAN
jgi:glyoxylase-like metal-dependent hydrolase (beta-lactamase superfamily II)